MDKAVVSPRAKDGQVLPRIGANLLVGLNFIHGDPDVLRGYLCGAIHELGAMISEMRGPETTGSTGA
jgi:hypothetical protein